VPHLVLRSTALGPTYGHLVLVPLADPAGPRAVTDTVCDRIYAVPAGGLCMRADRGVVTRYVAQLLDGDLRPTLPVTITGGPSRTRLSADGRYAATTVFVAGHSYTDVGFSTATQVVQVATGRSLGNLESWRIVKDGRRYTSADVNFWGVTFARDDNTFYATLSTRGRTYLVRGDIARREVSTLRENAECPSLSPDGARLVYKKAVGSPSARRWRFTALDLASGVETPLPEARSIDDQVAWLDAGHVLYAVPDASAGSARTDVWVSPVPPVATGTPRLLVPGAESPAAVPAVGNALRSSVRR
jgi:dipeptidyl aminopeptidase/acylaminoacyl peptidase